MDYADALSSSDHRLQDNINPSIAVPLSTNIMPVTDNNAPPPAAVVIEYIASEDLQPLPDPALTILVSLIRNVFVRCCCSVVTDFYLRSIFDC